MAAATTIVTIGTADTGNSFLLPMPLEVFTPYATDLVNWFATGEERTFTFRAMLPNRVADQAGTPIDVTLAREHVAFITTEVKHA
jgi:hypothetical protein